MVPIRSNSEKENCSPVSSNCVIWQGPDLTCINLCKGDSVSDVVYKLAVELCQIQESTNITAVDFDCLLTECANTPNPEATIAAILQLIIDNVCCSVSALTQSTSELTARTSNLYEEPILPLPSCLQYLDPVTSIPVTELVLSSYVLRLATEFCSVVNTVNLHTGQISNHETRITDLEDAPCCYIPPQVVPACSYFTGITAGVPTDMDLLLSAIDIQVCEFLTTIGTATQISNAVSQQCPLLGSEPALSQIGTMSSLPGWNNTTNSLAQSIQNLWITVCDMRAAIYDLKSCCQVDCSAFLLGYSIAENTSRNIITLTFNASTVIPSGFTNCPTLSTVTITDGIGNTYANTFDLVTESTNPTGVVFDITSAGLNAGFPYTVTVNGCITKDGQTCSKTVTQTTTTGTTTSLPCLSYNVVIQKSDLDAAIGNTNVAQDAKVYLSYFACGDSVATTVVYDVEGDKGNICVNPVSVPFLFYFASDFLTVGASTASIIGSCSTTTTTSTTSTTTTTTLAP